MKSPEELGNCCVAVVFFPLALQNHTFLDKIMFLSNDSWEVGQKKMYIYIYIYIYTHLRLLEVTLMDMGGFGWSPTTKKEKKSIIYGFAIKVYTQLWVKNIGQYNVACSICTYWSQCCVGEYSIRQTFVARNFYWNIRITAKHILAYFDPFTHLPVKVTRPLPPYPWLTYNRCHVFFIKWPLMPHKIYCSFIQPPILFSFCS